ncbi:hypothetical protein FRC03_005440 [Tulasnella sp. 419]|nr:hypothetical protein FRC03_005440 [Tulasnella sp. 419]
MSSQAPRTIEWSARVRCKERALGGSYSVLIFIGSVPDNEEEWRVSPSLAGVHRVFTCFMDGYPKQMDNRKRGGCSDATRSPEILNYTYPEFVGLATTDAVDLRKAIIKRLKELYGAFDVPGWESVHSQFLRNELLQERTLTRSKMLWKKATLLLRVRLDGEPPEDQHYWRTSPQFVGSLFAFVNSNPERCGNCVDRADSIIEGFVNLTHCLQNNQLGSLDPETVIPYLKDQLHWRIQKIDAVVVPASEVPDLEVVVMSVPLEYSDEAGFYKMKEGAEPVHYHDITA